ncbi:MAG: peptidoglycan editing factor PgeF [Mariprofundaceae bacterium]
MPPDNLPAGALIASRLLGAHGITGWFTTRLGEPEAAPHEAFDCNPASRRARRNIARLRRAGMPDAPHQAQQVHGAKAWICAGPGRIHEAEADILIACEPCTPVAVRTADCLPVLLADAEAEVVAAVHAGWRGIACGTITAAIRRMAACGANPARMLASLGPCIGPCCFEIGWECARQLSQVHPQAHTAIRTGKAGNPHADLAALARLQLSAAGLDASHIETIPACTACDPVRFHSHRRDAGHTGRHLAIVWLSGAGARRGASSQPRR